jgi:hypothetical protein
MVPVLRLPLPTWRDPLPTDMVISAVSVLVVALLSIKFLEGVRNDFVNQNSNQTVQTPE